MSDSLFRQRRATIGAQYAHSTFVRCEFSPGYRVSACLPYGGIRISRIVDFHLLRPRQRERTMLIGRRDESRDVLDHATLSLRAVLESNLPLLLAVERHEKR